MSKCTEFEAVKADREPRITLQGMKVLKSFVENLSGELSGADIARSTGLLSGTLYPLLIRFEHAGWLNSRWEDSSPVELARPKRRLYRITGLGAHVYRSRLSEMAAVGVVSWA